MAYETLGENVYNVFYHGFNEQAFIFEYEHFTIWAFMQKNIREYLHIYLQTWNFLK